MSRCFAICWPNLHIRYIQTYEGIHQHRFPLIHQVRLHFDALQLRRSTYWRSAYGATRHLCGILAGSCFQGVSRWMCRLGGSGDVALQINVTSASRTGQLPVKVEIFGSPECEKRLEKDITHIFSQSPKISSPVESIRIIMTSQHFTSCKCCEYLSHTVEIAWFLAVWNHVNNNLSIFSRFGNVRQIFTEKLKKIVAFSLTVFFLRDKISKCIEVSANGVSRSFEAGHRNAILKREININFPLLHSPIGQKDDEKEYCIAWIHHIPYSHLFSFCGINWQSLKWMPTESELDKCTYIDIGTYIHIHVKFGCIPRSVAVEKGRLISNCLFPNMFHHCWSLVHPLRPLPQNFETQPLCVFL